MTFVADATPAADPASAPAAAPAALKFVPDGNPVKDIPSFVHDQHAGMTHAEPHKSVEQNLYPEVDFTTGLGFLDQTHLATADSFKEKQTYLEKVYGKKNVSQITDPQGYPKLVVNSGGKKIAVQDSGFIADAVGSAPQTIGAAAGAVVGSAGGPLGTLAGAGLGAGIGKAATEIRKQFQGTYNQGGAEAVGNIARGAVEGAAGEAGGQLTTGLVSKVLRGKMPQMLSQTTPESNALTERTLAGGARPPAQSTIPGSKKIQFAEALARKTVSGVKSQDTANEAYIANRTKDILTSTGMPEHEASAVLREIQSGEARVPTEQIGEHVKTRVQAHADMLKDNVEARTKAATEQMDTQLSQLNDLSGRSNVGDLGVNVEAGIVQARQQFGQEMSAGYGKIDQALGGEPVVPISHVNTVAGDVGRLMPTKPGEQGGAQGSRVLRALGISFPGVNISLRDAQLARTLLREKAQSGNLTPGVSQHDMGRLADAMDNAISLAARNPAVAPYVKELQTLDGAYHSGIQKFNDATLNRLVKSNAAGLPPDPEQIASIIVQPGQAEKVRATKKMLGQETWQKVAGADYNRIMTAATNHEGQVDGIKLLTQIKQRGSVMKDVHGEEVTNGLTELGKSLAARDGKIPVDQLAEGSVKDTLKLVESAQKDHDKFMKENYMSRLVDPKANPESTYNWLVQPENSSALKSAVKLLGADSPQVKEIQSGALRQLLSNTKVSYLDGRSSDALSAALAKYTPEQQKLLFPNGLDSDLHLLGKETQFLMKNLSDEAKASMAAGAILGTPGLNIPVRASLAAYQILLSHPTTIRYLALGLRSPPGPARIAAKALLKQTVLNGFATADSDQGAPARVQQ